MKNNITRWLTALWAALLLSGCGGDSNDNATSPGQTIQSRETLLHDNLSREYILYIPAAYDGRTEVPLLLNFHGFSISAERHMNSAADMRALAEKHNFILVYPQGTRTQVGNLPNWNAARPSSGNNSGADDLGFIATLVGKLALQYQIDDKRIYAIGYSNGAMMSFALACYSDGLIAAVGSVSGTQLDTSANCAPAHPTAVLNIHGTSDLILPYNGGLLYQPVTNVLNFWRDHNNTSDTAVFNTVNDRGTPIEHYQYNQGTNNVAVEHYKVIGGGHSWFNFNYQGSATNELIWDFISGYDTDGRR